MKNAVEIDGDSIDVCVNRTSDAKGEKKKDKRQKSKRNDIFPFVTAQVATFPQTNEVDDLVSLSFPLVIYSRSSLFA